jgi:hypothetical protein
VSVAARPDGELGDWVGVDVTGEAPRASGEIRVPLRITCQRRWWSRQVQVTVEAHGEMQQLELQPGQRVNVNFTLTLR